MPSQTRSLSRVCWAVALCALATLLLELALTRIFSVVLFYHFAFMAISTALFGLGAGGVLAYKVEKDVGPGGDIWAKLGRLATMNGLLVVAALWVVLHRPLSFVISWENALVLATIYLACAFPFLLAGVVISLAISTTIRNVAKVYFSDLLGAAIGCLLLIPLLDFSGGPGAVMTAAAIYALSGAILHSMNGWNKRSAVSAMVFAGLAVAALVNPSLRLLDVKYAKGRSVAQEELALWNSFSRISVGPGQEGQSLILIDSDAGTDISTYDFDRLSDEDRRKLLSEGPSLPYIVKPAAKTLVIGAGGGMDLARSLASGSKDVSAVEINPIIVNEVMRGAYRETSHGLYLRPEIRVFIEDGRTFTRRSEEKYDVIQMTLVDSWASTAAGAFALAENHLYTTDAFRDYLEHLNDDGVIAVTRWEFQQPRESLRVVSVARAALASLGVADASRHVLVAREDSDQMAEWGAKDTILIRRNPFTQEQIDSLRAAAQANGMSEVYAPDQPGDNPFAQLLRTPDIDAFLASYPFDVSPVDDNRPFFFYTVPLPDLWSFILSPWNVDSKVNLGVLLLVASLGMSIVATLAILLLPRLLLGRQAPSGGLLWVHLAYFFAIGLGFILIEIALVQRIVFFLGQPTYALTVVIFSLLISSSLGSYFSQRFTGSDDRKTAMLLVGAAAAVGALIAAAPAAMDAALTQPLALKLLLIAALIFPAGFLMGMPFPTGLRRLEERFPNAVCWAWAINAAASVLGSVSAVFLGIHIGLTQTVVGGAVLYLAAALIVKLTTAAQTSAASQTQSVPLREPS
ncbi:MAG: hypothetical protein GC160_10505 [Acidobacteria bacterium]|nr:hypothetical protein [Acidobacteriota bacterium]